MAGSPGPRRASPPLPVPRGPFCFPWHRPIPAVGKPPARPPPKPSPLSCHKLLIKAFKSRSWGIRLAAGILQPGRTTRVEVGIQARDASRSLLFPTHPLAKLEHLWEETRLLRGWGWMEQHDASRLQRGSTEVSAEVQGPPSRSKARPSLEKTLRKRKVEERGGAGVHPGELQLHLSRPQLPGFTLVLTQPSLRPGCEQA